MGGSSVAIPLIQSVVGLMTGAMNKPEVSSVPDRAAELEAEQEAREKEQQQKEADERKRERSKIIEARAVEKAAADKARRTTMMGGSAGLTEDAETVTKQLKSKLGE